MLSHEPTAYAPAYTRQHWCCTQCGDGVGLLSSNNKCCLSHEPIAYAPAYTRQHWCCAQCCPSHKLSIALPPGPARSKAAVVLHASSVWCDDEQRLP
eukprot:1160146-Pelagomonas_calceolata.AAC.22